MNEMPVPAITKSSPPFLGTVPRLCVPKYSRTGRRYESAALPPALSFLRGKVSFVPSFGRWAFQRSSKCNRLKSSRPLKLVGLSSSISCAARTERPENSERAWRRSDSSRVDAVKGHTAEAESGDQFDVNGVLNWRQAKCRSSLVTCTSMRLAVL